LILADKVLLVKETKKTPICVIKSDAGLAVLIAHRSPNGVDAVVETVGAGSGDERRCCNAVTDTWTAAAAVAMATG
jgi:DhnA family fructose-bisphosphate aldolase class Ia